MKILLLKLKSNSYDYKKLKNNSIGNFYPTVYSGRLTRRVLQWQAR